MNKTRNDAGFKKTRGLRAIDMDKKPVHILIMQGFARTIAFALRTISCEKPAYQSREYNKENSSEAQRFVLNEKGKWIIV